MSERGNAGLPALAGKRPLQQLHLPQYGEAARCWTVVFQSSPRLAASHTPNAQIGGNAKTVTISREAMAGMHAFLR